MKTVYNVRGGGIKTVRTLKKTAKSLLPISHERQFNGEDYQAVAIDLCDQLKNPTDEDYEFLMSAPDPACECEFCKRAEWDE